MKKIVPCILFGVVIFSICSLNASTPVISVRPARTLIYVKPGETYTGNFLITNKEEKKVTVAVVGEDWTLMAQKKREKNLQWITLSKEKCTIGGLKTKRVGFKISVPHDAKGEKIAQIFFEPSFDDAPEGMLKTRMGVIVIVIVSGTERVDMGLPTVSLVKTDESHAAVRVRLENFGNVLLKWSADVSVTDAETGKDMGKAVISGSRSTLPGESRQIGGPLKGYVAKNSGNLTATVTINYGIGKDNEQKKTFVVPVQK